MFRLQANNHDADTVPHHHHDYCANHGKTGNDYHGMMETSVSGCFHYEFHFQQINCLNDFHLYVAGKSNEQKLHGNICWSYSPRKEFMKLITVSGEWFKVHKITKCVNWQSFVRENEHKTRYAWLTLSFFLLHLSSERACFLGSLLPWIWFLLMSGLFRITTSLPMRPVRAIMSYWWEWIIGMPWPALSQSNDPVLA